MACAVLPEATGFVSGMLGFLDCQAQTLGIAGFQALAAPGSDASLIITGLLTLFVAIFGYRLLLGETLTVREGILALVKIGIVLVMATSWPAYRSLVYDVALRGPAELAAQIGTPAGLPGVGGGMIARLDSADRALAALAVAGAGQPSAAAIAEGRIVPPPFGGFDAFAFGGARIMFLIAVIGAFAAVRAVAGILLALTPLFVMFLLFDATRGLFEGWLRVLSGTALASAGIALILGMELALIEPWLFALLGQRAAGGAIPDVPVQLLVVTTIFSLALWVTLYATARVALGLQLSVAWRAVVSAPVAFRPVPLLPAGAGAMHDAPPNEARSRAAAIADAVAHSQRREAALTLRAIGGQAESGPPSRAVMQGGFRDIGVPVPVPLGQSYRRIATRASASAARRDRT